MLKSIHEQSRALADELALESLARADLLAQQLVLIERPLIDQAIATVAETL